MALPRVNEVLQFTLTIPSTGKKVKYRPYLVKEEKVLLQAFESQDMKACLQAMCDTIEACLDSKSKVRVSELPTFDLEYIFIQMRGKSVGETSDIVITCPQEGCGHKNPYSVDLDKIFLSKESEKMVPITDSISVEMRYPSYALMMDQDLDNIAEQDVDGVFQMMTACIAAVHTSDERINCSEQSKEEMEEFLNSMTSVQLQGVADFLQGMPSINYDAKFECAGCGEKNTVNLKGLSDFF